MTIKIKWFKKRKEGDSAHNPSWKSWQETTTFLRQQNLHFSIKAQLLNSMFQSIKRAGQILWRVNCSKANWSKYRVKSTGKMPTASKYCQKMKHEKIQDQNLRWVNIKQIYILGRNKITKIRLSQEIVIFTFSIWIRICKSNLWTTFSITKLKMASMIKLWGWKTHRAHKNRQLIQIMTKTRPKRRFWSTKECKRLAG